VRGVGFHFVLKVKCAIADPRRREFFTWPSCWHHWQRGPSRDALIDAEFRRTDAGMSLRQLLARGDRPFLSHPQVDRYFPAASIEDARRRLGRCIERGEGPGTVIGAAGTGKSTLLQVLAAQNQERFDIVLLACAHVHTRRSLLQAIHFELGLAHEQRDEGELRLSLLDHLLSADQSSQGLLLLVDEAQSLPTQVLEEIRVVGNLSRNGAPLVRTVLAGLPPLEERLASPELDALAQRFAARCILSPLTRAETAQFAQAQLAACDAEPRETFAADAWDEIFEATDGVPRLVNQLCDRALFMADAQQRPKVDRAVVRSAWSDLQQLPAPQETDAESSLRESRESEVVEFGSLIEPLGDTMPNAYEANVQPRPVLMVERDNPARLSRSTPPSVDSFAYATAIRAEHPLRTIDDCAPDAVDPFADEFDEEEIVLDRFSPLAEMFRKGVPRVSNQRSPAVAHSVARTAGNYENSSANKQAPSQVVPVPSRVEVDLVPLADNQPERRDCGAGEPTIRLAVVDESVVHEPESSVAAPKRVISKSPVAIKIRAGRSLDTESPHGEKPVLVIEDELAKDLRPNSGAKRQAYRDLFSRLRHGA
jgi:type II secretory pathway predicted ATPase ExeA